MKPAVHWFLRLMLLSSAWIAHAATLTSSSLDFIIVPESPEPAIHGPRVVGGTPGRPFLFLIPATGEKPLAYGAEGLPEGLALDEKSGIIRGELAREGTTTVTLSVANARGKATRTLAIVAGRGKLALTPPMGWNSWNVWGKNVSAARIREAAEALIASGLAAHGYQYVNIDDTWEDRRDEAGRIQPNSRFADMKGLADFVHARGLKIGIYSSPGPETCAGYEGSWRHEPHDALSYAEWGIDYLKYDWCSYQQKWDGTDEGYQAPYIVMRRALDKVGRDIVYSICQYGLGQVWKWGGSPAVGGNLWRTTGDIKDTWISMSSIGFSESTHAPFSGPGRWNDPDMLVVGQLGWGGPLRPSGLTRDEQLTHVSLWCMLAAPLLIGCDLTELDDWTKALLTNDEVLEIDQDPLGKQAVRVDRQAGGCEVWARPLADGALAVGLFNRGKQAARASADWGKLGIGGGEQRGVRDLWRHKNLGIFKGKYEAEVPSHGVVLIRIEPASRLREPASAPNRPRARGASRHEDNPAGLKIAHFSLVPRGTDTISDQNRVFTARLVEMIKTFLYSQEGESAANAQGRRLWFDPLTLQLTIVDTPENVTRISRFINSLTVVGPPTRTEVVPLKHADADAVARAINALKQ